MKPVNGWIRAAGFRLLIEAAGAFPLLLVAGEFADEQAGRGTGPLALCAAWVLCGYLGIGLRAFLRRTPLWVGWIAGAAVLYPAFFAVFGGGTAGQMIFAAGCLLLGRGVFLKPVGDMPSLAAFMIVALILHLGGYLYFEAEDSLRPMLPWLYFSCYALLAMALYRWNADHLRWRSADHPVSRTGWKAVRTVNLAFVASFFLVFVLVGQASFITEGISQLFRWIRQGLAALFGSGGEADVPSGEAPPPTILPLKPPEENSASSGGLTEYLVQGLFYVLIGAAAIGLAYLFYRFIRFAFRAIAAILARLSERNDVDAGGYPGYEEEEYRLEKTKRRRRHGMLMFSSRQTPGDKVRELYRKYVRGAVRRGHVFQPSHTARETLALIASTQESREPEAFRADLARLYEQARYGNEPVKPEEYETLTRRRKG